MLFKIVVTSFLILLFFRVVIYDRGRDNLLIYSGSGCGSGELANCNFQIGDILVRKTKESQADGVVSMMHGFFTHSALYLGKGEILQAKGLSNEKLKKEDTVVVEGLMNSDWVSQKDIMIAWVVLRPRVDLSIKNDVVKKARSMAEDELVGFGLTLNVDDQRTVYCSQLIWSLYRSMGFEPFRKSRWLVMPDDFWKVGTEYGDSFEVVGQFSK